MLFSHTGLTFRRIKNYYQNVLLNIYAALIYVHKVIAIVFSFSFLQNLHLRNRNKHHLKVI